MLAFAATGVTLNHATDIPAQPVVTLKQEKLSPELLAAFGTPAPGKSTIPPVVAGWLSERLGVTVAGREAELAESEIYISLPRPGGDAWMTLDIRTGDVRYEDTDRGWISYLNDLHKGRNTGRAWAWFIDIFAVGCVVFCLTGLFLLQLHSGNRPATWPIVGLGLVIPLLLAILFIH